MYSKPSISHFEHFCIPLQYTHFLKVIECATNIINNSLIACIIVVFRYTAYQVQNVNEERPTKHNTFLQVFLPISVDPPYMLTNEMQL